MAESNCRNSKVCNYFFKIDSVIDILTGIFLQTFNSQPFRVSCSEKLIKTRGKLNFDLSVLYVNEELIIDLLTGIPQIFYLRNLNVKHQKNV